MIRGSLLVLIVLGLVVGVAQAQPLTLASVHGRYTTTFLGVQSGNGGTRNIPAAESGAMISNGAGGLQGFLSFDFDGSTVAICSLTGTYTVGHDPVAGEDGFVVLNLQFPTCDNVSCPNDPVTNLPACTTKDQPTFVGLPEVEWCALSGASGAVLDCTLMGEIGFPNVADTHTLLFPPHWERH